MRKLLLAVLVLLSFQGKAQLSMNGGKYVYHKTYRQSGSGEELFDKATGWVTNNVDRSKATVSVNQDDLYIQVNGSYEDVKGGMPNVINYTLKIEFLSGVYRETFTDFSYKSKGRELPYESRKLGGKKAIMKSTYSMIDEMSEDFTSYMSMELSASDK